MTPAEKRVRVRVRSRACVRACVPPPALRHQPLSVPGHALAQTKGVTILTMAVPAVVLLVMALLTTAGLRAEEEGCGGGGHGGDRRGASCTRAAYGYYYGSPTTALTALLTMALSHYGALFLWRSSP
jgi:hypothetical protein